MPFSLVSSVWYSWFLSKAEKNIHSTGMYDLKIVSSAILKQLQNKQAIHSTKVIFREGVGNKNGQARNIPSMHFHSRPYCGSTKGNGAGTGREEGQNLPMHYNFNITKLSLKDSIWPEAQWQLTTRNKMSRWWASPVGRMGSMAALWRKQQQNLLNIQEEGLYVEVG